MLIGQSWRDAVAVIGGTPGGNGLLISGNKGAWRGKVKLKQQTGRTHAAGGARLSTHTQAVSSRDTQFVLQRRRSLEEQTAPEEFLGKIKPMR